jgi:glutaredoxin-related protein
MDLCKKLIESSPFIVFIKGTPEKPKCKFTRALLAELKTLNLKFNFYDMDND